jgi:hypothetical protein
MLLCVVGVCAGFVGMRKTYPWLGPLEMLVASVISILSAIALYLLFSGMTPKSQLLPHDTFVFVTFNLSFTATIWLLLRRAQTVRRILARGFLVGGVQWALLVVVAAMFAEAPPILATKAPVALPSVWSLPLGAGVLPLLNVTVGLAMAAVCATGFALVHFLTRERESPITLRRPAGGHGDFEMTMRGLERRA